MVPGRVWFSNALFAILLATGSANAVSTVSDSDIAVFLPSDLEARNPQTAWDFVTHIPGFELTSGSRSGRGLAASGGNVLLDGRRPPAKSGSVQTWLREVRADQVLRFELIDAGARDIDFAGHDKVLNVVSRSAVRPTGDLSVGTRATSNASWTVIAGLRTRYVRDTLSLRGGMTGQRDFAQTEGRVLPPTASRPFERVVSGATRTGQRQSVDFGLDTPVADAVHLSLSGNLSSNVNQSEPNPPSNAPSDLVLSASHSESERRNLGADFTLADWLAADWTLTVSHIASQSSSGSEQRQQGSRSALIRDRSEGETAARVSARFEPFEAVSGSAALSVAHNYLAGASQLSRDGTVQPVTGSDTRVEEARAGAEAGLTWSPFVMLRAEAGLRVDWSELTRGETATGGVALPYALTDWAPRGQLSFTPAEDLRVRLSLERQIGQLAFSQFLSSASLDSDEVVAGAAQLEPERRWTALAEVERRFGARGAAKINIVRNEIENPIRRIPLENGVTVQANVEPAVVETASASLNAPVDDLPIPWVDLLGASVTATLTKRDSEIIDPITGERRSVSGSAPLEWRLNWQHILGDGDWEWGFGLSDAASVARFSPTSLSTSDSRPAWNAFVEWDVFESLETRLQLTGARRNTSRSVSFEGVRGETQPAFDRISTSRTDLAWALNAAWRPRSWVTLEADFNSGAASSSEAQLLLRNSTERAPAISSQSTPAVQTAGLRLRLTH